MKIIPDSKKIAIVHDSLTHLGGAERVLLELVKLFPNADIYTSLAQPTIVKWLATKTYGKIFVHPLSRWHFFPQFSSYLKPLFFIYFENLDLTAYDLVISSSHSFCSNWLKTTGLHVSYIHTPPRYLYQEFNETTWIHQFPFQQLLAPYFHYLRSKNFNKQQVIPILGCNSRCVQKRIHNYYQRSAKVIYPPVNIQPFLNTPKKPGKYYVFFSRLVKQKGVELALQTFQQLPSEELYIIGEGSQRKKLEKIASSNIHFLGWLDDQNIPAILAHAKALIFPAIEEDFGIVPVEAMAAGLPVIAYYSGGVQETVIANKTGIFFKTYTVNSLKTAIMRFKRSHFSAQACRKQAQKFSKENFNKQFLALIKKATA